MKSERALDNEEHDRKSRTCLRCQTVFDSTWAGERICVRCKGSNAWRNSGPVEIRAPRSRSPRAGGS